MIINRFVWILDVERNSKLPNEKKNKNKQNKQKKIRNDMYTHSKWSFNVAFCWDVDG